MIDILTHDNAIIVAVSANSGGFHPLLRYMAMGNRWQDKAAFAL